MMPPPLSSRESPASFGPLRAGVRAALATPGTYILMLGFFGFGGFAREAGFTLLEGVFMSATTWALPNQVLLVGAVVSGASLGAAFLVVTAAAIRMTPMMASLMPLIEPDPTRRAARRGRLLLLSMVQAITSWIELQRRLPDVAPEERYRFALGLGGTIWAINVATTALGMAAAGEVPPGVQAALALLLPAYFLFGLVAAWRGPGDAMATVLGAVLGPVLHPIAPNTSLLWAGLLGGTFAFLLQSRLPIEGRRS